MYSEGCCGGSRVSTQLGDLGFSIPWGTIIGAGVDVGTSLFGGDYPKPLPPPLDATAADVQRGMAARPDLARQIIEKMKGQGHTKIYLGRNPTSADWANPQTAAALALWFANGTGDDLSRGEDEIRQLVREAVSASIPLNDVWTPPGGVVQVNPDGSIYQPSQPSGFPSTTGTQGSTTTSDGGGITGFLKDQLDQLKENAAALLQLQAQQAAQAAAGGAYNALPPGYQAGIDAGVGRSMLEKYAIPAALAGAVLYVALRR